MEERKLRWGIGLDDTFGAFLLGANVNIQPEQKEGYLCVYLGFRTLVIGRTYF